MSQENKNPSNIPPERELEYLTNAEAVVHDATDPVIEKLAKILIEDAETTAVHASKSLDPVGEAERLTKNAADLANQKAPDDIREIERDEAATATLMSLFEGASPSPAEQQRMYRALARPDLSKKGFGDMANSIMPFADKPLRDHLTEAQHEALAELDENER